MHLAAALHGVAAMVLTTLPPGAITLAGLRLALNNRFGIEQQSELVKTHLVNRKRKPQESIGELAHDIRRAVGIAYADMAASMQERLALDHFVQALSESDCGAQLAMWRPPTMSQAVDAAARYEVARPLTRGGERHPVAVRLVGPTRNGGSTEEPPPERRADLVEMVRGMVNRQLVRFGPWQVAPMMAPSWPPINAETRNYRGGNSEYRRLIPYQVRCCNCGLTGHLSQDCRTPCSDRLRYPGPPTPPRTDRTSQPSTPPPGPGN